MSHKTTRLPIHLFHTLFPISLLESLMMDNKQSTTLPKALNQTSALGHTIVAGTASPVQFAMAESDASSEFPCWSRVNACVDSSLELATPSIPADFLEGRPLCLSRRNIFRIVSWKKYVGFRRRERCWTNRLRKDARQETMIAKEKMLSQLHQSA